LSICASKDFLVNLKLSPLPSSPGPIFPAQRRPECRNQFLTKGYFTASPDLSAAALSSLAGKPFTEFFQFFPPFGNVAPFSDWYNVFSWSSRVFNLFVDNVTHYPNPDTVPYFSTLSESFSFPLVHNKIPPLRELGLDGYSPSF